MRLNQYLWRIACETKKALVKKFNIPSIQSFKKLAGNDKCAKNSYGYCSADRHIRIGLRNPHTNKPVKWETVINTVCHELAHLTYHHHKRSWYRLYRKYFNYVMRGL